MENTDQKGTDEDANFVKEESEPTRNYIFQKSTITKIAVIIVIGFLVLLVLGLVASGTTFFSSE